MRKKLTWAEFKRLAESKGVTDETVIDSIEWPSFLNDDVVLNWSEDDTSVEIQ